MELRYQHAIISYCPRLTEPDGVSVPVAIVLVGATDGAGVAGALVAPEAERIAEDPLTRAVTRDLLRILKGHVDEAAAQTAGGQRGREQVLRTLQHSFRNSLFVSSVSDEVAAPLASLNDISAVVVEALRSRLLDSMKRALRELERQARAPVPRYELDPGTDFFGPFAAWPLPFLPGSRDSHPG